MVAIDEVLASLSPDDQQKVLEFITNLKEKNPKKKRNRLKVDWRGALEEYKDRFTSMELQDKSRSWWVT